MKFSIKGKGVRCTAILLALLLVITALPLSVSAADAKAKTTAAVHLRSGKGTGYSSKGVLAKGTTVTVTDKSDDTWYAVELENGKTGYVFAEYLKSTKTESTGTEIGAKTNECVRLRSGPGTEHDTVVTLKEGAEVTVTDTSNSKWYAVRTASGKTGYIFAVYLDLSDTPTATEKPEPTKKPAATEEPEPTEKPTATEKPAATEKPTATEKPAEDKVQKAKTTAPLHLRKKASTTAKSLGVIASGTTVTVLDTSNGEWYKVETSSGKVGYMFADYLKLIKTSSSNAESVEAVTTTYVRLRSGAGTSYYSKGIVPDKTKVTVTDRSNKDWYAVKLPDGRTGYIYAIYLKVTEPAATATPKPTAEPTAKPTAEPTAKPTAEPTEKPEATAEPSAKPTAEPSAKPSAEPTEKPEPEKEEDVIAKTTAALNLRKGPSTADKRVQVVAKGTKVTVLAVASDPKWYKVQLEDGTEGYFSIEYLKIVSGDVKTLEPEEAEEEQETDRPAETEPEETKYVRTTASGLNFRSGPGTGYSKIAVLSSGTVLTVLAETENGWIKGETSAGKVGYVSKQYVSDYDPSNASAQLPEGDETLPKYKTLYLNANTSGTVYWSSSDEDVAQVSSASGRQVFVYGAGTGTATITAKNASGKVLTSKTVTVTSPEAVRFAYTNPNMIVAGQSFDWIAITDAAKDEVKFVVDGLDKEFTTTEYETETQKSNTVRVFSVSAAIEKPGTYTVKVYSRAEGGKWSKNYKEISVCVTGTEDFTQTSAEERRISTKMLDLVASYEGYRPTVYADTLAGNIPTVGYGYVVNKNTSFYNNLTKSEALAMLAYTLNTRTYTAEVNKFVKKNNMRINQQQFDTMVSFSYNVGAGYWNSTSKTCYIRTVLLNTYALTDASASNPYTAKATETVPVYSEHDGGSERLTTYQKGDKVKVIGYYRNEKTAEAWYKIQLDGSTGWARSGDLSLTDADGLVRDLAYVDGYTFASHLLEWHKASGRCYMGLYYRRLGESKIFAFGNYEEAMKNHKNYKKNTYGFDLPSCV